MSGLLDRYEALCAAAREGRVRYAVVCGGERQDPMGHYPPGR